MEGFLCLKALMTELCSPNSYVGALPLSMTIAGDRAFKEVIKAKKGNKGGGHNPAEQVSLEEEL